MNLHTRGKKNSKEDYSETNPRPKEELAKEIIGALDGAVKRIARGERGKPLSELLDELDEYVMEERKNAGT